MDLNFDVVAQPDKIYSNDYIVKAKLEEVNMGCANSHQN
ncbi:MAG: hypothetical protein C5S44_01120 [Candidatus Methanocomedens sp.]|nr:MAG: hypothetical protein C5S44_01120 [ANME-2 cluster archaeon]